MNNWRRVLGWDLSRSFNYPRISAPSYYSTSRDTWFIENTPESLGRMISEEKALKLLLTGKYYLHIPGDPIDKAKTMSPGEAINYAKDRI